MLERPPIADDIILRCLRDGYGLDVTDLAFLPLGADVNTAVWHAASARAAHFVKLRRGQFDPVTVLVPAALRDCGITQVVAPLPNRAGALVTPLEAFHLIVYPFINGASGFERLLTAANWTESGQALRRIHAAPLPPDLGQRLPRETYSPYYRQRVTAYLSAVATTSYHDPIAEALAALMRAKHDVIRALARHAEMLAARLQPRKLPLVLCHADIHVGNLLITEAGETFIVDWDTVMLAPKERDLMFAGMGLGSGERFSPDEQAALFYAGYGQTEVDSEALAYYRCERIVQDVFEFCEQILRTAGDSPDRAEGLRHFTGQFEPGAVVERAFHALAAVEVR